MPANLLRVITQGKVITVITQITYWATPKTETTPESSRLRLRLHFNDSRVYAYTVNIVTIQKGRLFSCGRLSLGRCCFPKK